jgi:hypothetical protein
MASAAQGAPAHAACSASSTATPASIQSTPLPVDDMEEVDKLAGALCRALAEMTEPCAVCSSTVTHAGPPTHHQRRTHLERCVSSFLQASMRAPGDPLGLVGHVSMCASARGALSMALQLHVPGQHAANSPPPATTSPSTRPRPLFRTTAQHILQSGLWQSILSTQHPFGCMDGEALR